MRIEVLGTFCVRVEGRPVSLTSRREVLILTALALSASKTASMEHCIDVIWPEDPPATSRQQVQNCAAVLRRRFRQLTGRDVLERWGTGYKLVGEVCVVDAAVFEQLAHEGRAAQQHGDHSTAISRYRQALRIWQGDPILDADPGPLYPELVRLSELRWAVYEDCIELEQPYGLDAARLAELRSLVERMPTRERLVASLMRGLAASGRTIEALDAYQVMRQRLVEEFGMEPGHMINAVHAEVLGQAMPSAPALSQQGLLDEALTALAQLDAVRANLQAAIRGLTAEYAIINPQTRGAFGTARTGSGRDAFLSAVPGSRSPR